MTTRLVPVFSAKYSVCPVKGIKIIEKESVYKLVGMTEVSKIGEAYPIEVTLKKVLK